VSAEADSGSITFKCECGQSISVPVERAGARGRCKACGRKLVVPAPAPPDEAEAFESSQSEYVSPIHATQLEGTYSEEDLITYPREAPISRKPAAPEESPAQKGSMLAILGDILKYPVATKLAAQIFLSGAVLFSPLVWKVMIPFEYFCCLAMIVNPLVFVIVISIRLMYFSYLLLIIEKSARGDRRIPELPVFQEWQDNVKDLVRVLAASAVAFSPYLVYSASINIQVFAHMLEAFSRSERLGDDVMLNVSGSLGAQVLLYAIAAFYMPMVLMSLVMTKNFANAINPVCIFRSIRRIAREYLTAMIIIFFFLRGSLTLLTILKDILASDELAAIFKYLGEPVLEFYVFVATMHVIGLLYHRNREKLQWS